MGLIEKLSAIGDAIREKNGTTELIPLADMPQAILGIACGGGASYTDIVYNEDNTITLTDKDGTEHTMVCTYENSKLVGVTYDGRKIDLLYDGAWLDKVGRTDVNLEKIPTLDYTVTFVVEGKPYKIVDLTDGLLVDAPSVNPTSSIAGEHFRGWKDGDEFAELPCVPEKNIVFNAYFQSVREEMELYTKGSFVAEDEQGATMTKADDGRCIGGYSDLNEGHGFVMLVAETAQGCQLTPDDGAVFKGTINYAGATYYYCGRTAINGIQKVADGILDTGYKPNYIANSNAPEMAKRVLDKYFYVT